MEREKAEHRVATLCRVLEVSTSTQAESRYFVFKSALAKALSGRRGSNPQLQPWEGAGPLLNSTMRDNRH